MSARNSYFGKSDVSFTLFGAVGEAHVKRGEIKGAKIGGRVKIDKESVLAYLAAHGNEKAPVPETEALRDVAKKLTTNKDRRPGPGPFRFISMT